MGLLIFLLVNTFIYGIQLKIKQMVCMEAGNGRMFVMFTFVKSHRSQYTNVKVGSLLKTIVKGVLEQLQF